MKKTILNSGLKRIKQNEMKKINGGDVFSDYFMAEIYAEARALHMSRYHR